MKDPLREVLKRQNTERTFKIPLQSHFFKDNSIDLEYFNLSFSSRVFLFIITFILASILFTMAMFNLLTAFIRPAAFALPYALSNILFFLDFGFIFGFKSYLKNVFNAKRRPYAVSFIVTTLMTIYLAFRGTNYIFSLCAAIAQIICFVMLVVSVLPGGTKGMSSMVNLLIKK
ncbi:hypothetical protein EDEG_03713 [Edhazardia aedis USNM 41457]|uniref:Protein transport protein SFT2 n=1 Tax=Edhazardia aedis (strain USNM 41457) TaxID=1003232 RepID=J9DGR8_EDHAE|nr:hypothetical protein EDEG_03713 [Edhazardia aedis USNM 41457]|eukprot:EJW01805.1 hypothetical protein EDEG_03713 [Edhazardia aedis USNM 41457]